MSTRRIQQERNSKGSKINWGKVGNTAAGIASLIPEDEMTIGGTTFKRGLWDAADPTAYLANGRESDTGNTLSDLGVSITKGSLASGQWYGALLGAGLKIAGSIANAGWGIKGNKENIAKVQQATDRANTIGKLVGQSRSNRDLLDFGSQLSNGSGINSWDQLYENGWFTTKGTDKGNELINKEREALAFQNHAYSSTVDKVDRMNDEIALANSAAYGGPIFNNNDNMSAIDYSFMSDYLNIKRQKTQQDNNQTNLFAGVSPTLFGDGGLRLLYPRRRVLNTKGFGGNLDTHGADFSTGLTHIDEGGTHEQNPNEGVQVGVDPNGNPNLVEEGEVIYGDYVFSNRIALDDEAKEKLGLSSKEDIFYSDAAKKFEPKERPNDPISKETFDTQMQILAEQQERQKKAMEAEKAREAFNALSPEEQTAVMQNAAQQEQAAQEEAMQQEALAQQQAAEEQMQQPSPEELAAMQQQEEQQQQELQTPPQTPPVPQVAACGGKLKHKYAPGGLMGLAGPVVGLGMMTAGIGKPNYDDFTKAVEIGNSGVKLADYVPVTQRAKYTPFDIWSGLNRLQSSARATDRAILNSNNPGRYAGLLASGLNAQLAEGELYRQALESEEDRKMKALAFNADIDKYNSDEHGRTSEYNAGIINADKQFRTGLALDVAKQKLDTDASWYNSLYGNVNSLFKGLGDYGKQGDTMKMIAGMAKQGLFGTIDEESPMGKLLKYYDGKSFNIGAKGGKLNRKKNN